MWGTADEVDVWLLLEYRSSWEARVVTDNSLNQASRTWLEGTVKAVEAIGLKVRVQFIRQPESDRDVLPSILGMLALYGKLEQFDYSRLRIVLFAGEVEQVLSVDARNAVTHR